jgi:beta-galactosidase/beta-glucuronidase
VRLKRACHVIHRFQQRFGFRTFEVRDGDGLYLNGQDERFFGIPNGNLALKS